MAWGIQERMTGYKKTTRRFEHYQEAWQVLLAQTYIKTLDFYASPIKNKTTSLSFALFVLLVHNFLLSLGLQLLTYKLAYYETSMWS